MITVDCNKGMAALALATDPCSLFFELAKRFPGAPISLRVGSESILVFQSAAALSAILQSHAEHFAKNFGPFMIYFGKSRLTTDGEDWRQQQKVSQSYISGRNSEAIVKLAVEYYSRAAKSMIAEQQQKGVVAIDRHLDHAALSVLLGAVFLIEEGDLGTDFLSDMRKVLRVCADAAWTVPGAPFPHSDEEMAEAKHSSRQIVEALDRLRRTVAGRPELDRGLIMSLAAQETDKVSFAAEICTLLFAGFDTTSAALSWMLFLIAREDELQRDLRREIAKAIGTGPVTAEAVEGMPLLTATISEALRLFPVIPLLSRIARDAVEIDGLALDPGQRILLSIIGLHHDPMQWEEPSRFEVTRFAPGAGTPGTDHHYLPFGLGKRGCGGMRFARLELAVAIATLLMQMEIRTVGPTPLHFDWQISLRLRGGHQLSCLQIRR